MKAKFGFLPTLVLIGMLLLSACGSVPSRETSLTVPIEFGSVIVSETVSRGHLVIESVHWKLYEEGLFVQSHHDEQGGTSEITGYGVFCFPWERPEGAIHCRKALGVIVWTEETPSGGLTVKHSP